MPLPAQSTAVIDKVSQLLAREGHQGYLVGGFIRDWLLDRQTSDIDIAVSGDAIRAAREVARSVHGKFVLLDELNSIARVVIPKGEDRGYLPRTEAFRQAEWHLDFAPFSTNIGADLGRRDFTINAMAVELGRFASRAARSTGQVPSGENLIDPFSGEDDLKNGVIRAVGEQVFEADAVRLLRGVRLAAELGFSIEPTTEQLIRRYCQSIIRIPGERIREELLRLLSLPRAAHYLRYLDELGLLVALIPELADGKGVEQPTVHFWDVFDHSLQTVAALEFLLRENEWECGSKEMLDAVPWSDSLDQHFSQEVSKGSSRRPLLKLGGLLHDVAKPATRTIDDSGRARFLGHPKQGAATVEAIMSRLRFSRQETSLVVSLVYHHMRPAQMTNGALPTQRAIYRYFRDTKDAGIDILFLALADHLATRGPLVRIGDFREQCRLTDYVLAEHQKQEVKVSPPKLVDGHDLMNELGLGPGPLIGSLLALVCEAQASGELASREEAVALAREELTKRQAIARTGS